MHKQVPSATARLDQFLSASGVGPTERVTVISDDAGEFGKAVEGSQLARGRILDWFHIAMKFKAAENSVLGSTTIEPLERDAVKMSLVVGIALDRSPIRSIDEPIFSFFPELADLRTPEKDRLLLRHAVTMTMGLQWVDATPDTGDENNDEARMHRAADPCRYVLGLPTTAPAGQEFFYKTVALTLVSAVVRKATGRPLDELAREALFDPLGSCTACGNDVSSPD